MPGCLRNRCCGKLVRWGLRSFYCPQCETNCGFVDDSLTIPFVVFSNGRRFMVKKIDLTTRQALRKMPLEIVTP